jgi:hypothetical protein
MANSILAKKQRKADILSQEITIIRNRLFDEFDLKFKINMENNKYTTEKKNLIGFKMDLHWYERNKLKKN